MRWLITVAASLLTAVFIGLAAAGGWFYWDRVQTRSEQSARAVLPPLAAKEIPEVFVYDYQTVERSLNDAYPLLTPDFRHEFQRALTSRSSRRRASGRSSCRPGSSVWESWQPNASRRR
jgi:Mce-associated membrane protein